MLTDAITSGELQWEDGFCMATGVTLSMMIGQEPDSRGDIKSTLMVHDDPAFARRYVGQRFVFVSAHDPEEKVEIYIVGADGACIAFPMMKTGALLSEDGGDSIGDERVL